MKLLTSALLILAAIPVAALGQAYPSKPVHILIPFPAGSLNDILARQVSLKLSPALGQPVIAENRVGAGGRIAATTASKAPPDGYTLLLGSASTHVVAPAVVINMPYDPVRDFTPIVNVASPATGMIVNAALPVNTLREFIDYAKKNPGKISYGSNGIGSTHQLRGEFIKAAAGIDMLHVPFAGSNELVTAILGNTVQMTFIVPGNVKQHIDAGRVRHIAMTTPKRYAVMPNIPTVVEVLPSYEPIVDWFAFFGPAGVARPIVLRLNGEILKILQMPDVLAVLDTQSLIVIGGTPDDLAAQVKRELPIYAKAVKAAGVTPQ